MSWKDTCAMKERLGFVLEVERGERTVSELCRVFGISRKTGYKMLGRYRELGAAGLEDLSRAPHTHPNAISKETAADVVRLRRRFPDWGPLKLLDWLERHKPHLALPAPCTAAELLKREGLVKARARKRHSTPYGAPFVHATAANDLWSADFKGQFRMGNGELCYPLTLSDGASRFFLCCQALSRATYAQTRPSCEHAFREYGLPCAMRTDNGEPFASCGLGGLSRLSLWWIKLGIIPERIRPGRPEQNSRHERLHGTLKRGCAVEANLKQQQRAFDHFRYLYNTERSHQSLGRNQTPAMHYQPSARPYPSKVPELSYPETYVIKRVRLNGSISWVGRDWYMAALLYGELIGLNPIDDGIWIVFVGPVAVARLDARAKRIAPINSFIDIPTLH
jgi:transposase InsO family protein